MTTKPYYFNRKDFSSGGPLVSVVTPFYNTALYLEECIESVLNQTYGNWEYILADNCSTDESGGILEKYAAKEPRIRIVREVEFLGQVANYNRALRYISPGSKYCKIVQADDWLYPNCLEEMVAVAESRDNVGLVSSFCLYGNWLGQAGLSLSRGPVYTGREAAKLQLFGTMLFGSPTGVMYLSDIVRSREQFFSTTTPYYEDTEVCFEILRDHDFGFVPQVLTFNRSDNDSIWGKLKQHNPLMLYDIMFTYRFGPDFLDREEFVRQVREVEGRYYHFLARCALQGHDRDFWEFHRKGLAGIGQELSYRRVAYHVLAIIVDAALNPKHTIERLWHRVKKRDT